MPDEIGWLTPEDEALLDEARREAMLEAPATEADDAELERHCAEAKRFRLKLKTAEKKELNDTGG